MKETLYAISFVAFLGLICVAASIRTEWQGSIPGSPYFTTNILVEELTNSVTFTISNGCPFVIKQ